jgi:anthranilate phosphoribosyltransferase
VKRAWVVHGSGLDEVSLCGPTTVAAFDEGEDGAEVRTFTVTPADAGLAPCGAESLRGGDAAASAAIAGEVLGGQRGPRRDVVVLNAEAALVVAGRAESLKEGAAQAARAIDEGRASRLLERVRELSRS